MEWLFHIVERSDGRWVCHHGDAVDYFSALESAIAHAHQLAGGGEHAKILVHPLSGYVRRLGDV